MFVQHEQKSLSVGPRKLANCIALEVVDLGENLLNGTFPIWWGSLPRLQVLSLRSNRLRGPITTSRNQVLFSKLKILDLSYNDFSGNLSESFVNNLKSMIVEDRTGTPLTYIGEIRFHDSLILSIKGQQIELVRILSIFTTIDFSNNKFQGDVPKSIGNLGSLRGLNLSHNSLIGPIPQSFGNLSVLESLDLSWNQLSGNIPQEVASLKSLAVMNLSQNHLMGRIPRGPQLDTFENDSYSGNAGLCGFPLSRNCGDNEMPHSTVQLLSHTASETNPFHTQLVGPTDFMSVATLHFSSSVHSVANLLTRKCRFPASTFKQLALPNNKCSTAS